MKDSRGAGDCDRMVRSCFRLVSVGSLSFANASSRSALAESAGSAVSVVSARSVASAVSAPLVVGGVVLVRVTLSPVTFELNALLDLSCQATTKSLSSLQTELLLQVLSKSTWTVAVRVICGDGGVGDIPGVRGGSRGGLKVVHNRTRLIQELRLRV